MAAGPPAAVKDSESEGPGHALLPTAALDELTSLLRLDAPEAIEDRSSLQADLADRSTRSAQGWPK